MATKPDNSDSAADAKAATAAKKAAAAQVRADKKADAEVREDAAVAKLEAQLEAWSTQLDDLVAERVTAGAHVSDPYHARIEAMRSKHTQVQAQLDAFLAPADGGGSWSALRAAIKDDLAGLEASFEDLTQ